MSKTQPERAAKQPAASSKTQPGRSAPRAAQQAKTQLKRPVKLPPVNLKLIDNSGAFPHQAEATLKILKAKGSQPSELKAKDSWLSGLFGLRHSSISRTRGNPHDQQG